MLEFPANFLNRPIKKNKDAVDALIPEFLWQLFTVNEGQGDIVQRVRSLIGEDFSQPLPTMESAAEHFNMAVPTLIRQLKKQGTSYQNIKDQARCQRAQVLLLEDKYSIAKIALLIGFSDAGTFSRAFKKWTGVSPGAFKKTGEKSPE